MGQKHDHKTSRKSPAPEPGRHSEAPNAPKASKEPKAPKDPKLSKTPKPSKDSKVSKALESSTAPTPGSPKPPKPGSPKSYFSRELSWLMFARRVLALVENPELPLLERVKFAGIVGMLHDEFFMKRMSGLKRQIKHGSTKLSIDGRLPKKEFEACRKELIRQTRKLTKSITQELRPALAREGAPILDYDELDTQQKKSLRRYFKDSVMPVLTPLAVDSEHPFPFMANLGLDLAVVLSRGHGKRKRFVRIKVPDNLPRWVPAPVGAGFTPLEQVIAANIDLMYSSASPRTTHMFRITRGAEGDTDPTANLRESDEPGSIVELVSSELKARRFAGVVRLQVSADMPSPLRNWLAKQLGVDPQDVYSTECFLGLTDLLKFQLPERSDLRYPPYVPTVHPRLQRLPLDDPGAIFEEIARGDLLLHHPYHCFDSSVLRFIESAAHDPAVQAVKLTIYRTSSDSPIVKALAEAARRGKQVAVLIEVTARFDEAPNIEWGRYLENEGVHVAYGVERLKTHVKLALVVRQEGSQLRRYAHVGTGNYHPGTARVYEDMGVLTADPKTCEDVAAVFNGLTGVTPYGDESRLLVAPLHMRKRFTSLIQREVEHAQAGRPCGIHAKMNQLQDPEIIHELYFASAAGVPITLNIRGLCCLRPGVPGLSDTIRVFSVVGRFLEHSRVFCFANGGDPEYFIGSADWMKRNLSSRVETVLLVGDEQLKMEIDQVLDVYERDNSTAWDCGPDGVYVRRTPREGEERRAAQEEFVRRSAGFGGDGARALTADVSPGNAADVSPGSAANVSPGSVGGVSSRSTAGGRGS